MISTAVPRRLAAIMMADVVGYSRLMAADEAGTVAALKRCHNELWQPIISRHAGRTIDLAGDSALAEFSSVTAAVDCAVEIQLRAAQENESVPVERRMQLRMGIHCGEIIVDGPTIYGDDINIAARLQSLAEPGGVCVSGAVQEQVGRANLAAFEDMGEPDLKNIDRRIRVYRLRLDEFAALAGRDRGRMAPLGERPSVIARPAAFALVDIIGYSAMLPEDEEGTDKRWLTIVDSLVEPLARDHGARFIKLAGDDVFAEFETALDAVHWAQQLQAASTEPSRITDDPTRRPIAFRIAIHVGMIIDADDIPQGDDVRIAACLKEHAQPGGIVLSGAVLREIRGHTLNNLRSVGHLRFEHILPHAVEAYELPSHLPLLSATIAPHATTPLPSIAVLPLQCLGPSTAHQYLAEGIIEDIVVSLASLRELFVVARSSALGLGQSNLDVAEIGRMLGVRYIARGSLRYSAKTLRIAIQLLDSHTGESLWGDSVEVQPDEVFDLQERIVERIVAGIAPHVRSRELREIRRRRPENYTAYDCTLKALALIDSPQRESFMAAQGYLTRAMELDPGFAMPVAWAARWQSLLVGQRWSKAPSDDARLALDLASRAIDLDHQNSLALATYGHLKSFLYHDYDVGLVYLDRALASCPNNALAWLLSSATLSYIGECAKAVQNAEHALRLSPLDRGAFYFHMILALANYASEDYEAGVKWARLALAENPSYMSTLKILTASLSALHRMDEAKQTAAQLLALDPDFSLSEFERTLQPFRKIEIKTRYIKHLGHAGLPR